MNQIINTVLPKGIDYKAYRQMIDNLLEQGKTTGNNHSEDMLHYTKMNVVRMNRLDKKTVIQDEAKAIIERISSPQTWLVITEAWCGDAAQILPVIHKLASLNPLISLKHVLRDENEDLMNLFLTNGGKSIPIIIILDEKTEEIIGHWGPRPSVMQQIVINRKNDPNASPYSEFILEAQKWYAKDKTRSIQAEFVNVFG